VLKFNTFLHGKESRLYRFKSLYPEIEKEYKNTRKRYAYYLFKNFLKGRRDCLKWHKEHLLRKITFKEYIQGILSENFFSYKLKRAFTKKKR
jgi:hypothetical protein